VTGPSKPELMKFIPGPPNTWMVQVAVADRKMIGGMEKFSPEWGGNPDQPFGEGILVWDIKDPVKPLLKRL